MKRLTQIFQALLGVVALIFTAIFAFGRLTWRTIRNWWKNRSKWFRYLLIAIGGVTCIGYIYSIAYDIYDDKYGRNYWNDRSLTDDIEVHAFNDQTVRLYDSRRNKYTTDKIYWVAETPKRDYLVAYAMPNSRGYIDINNGRICFEARDEWDGAWNFSEGKGAVLSDGWVFFIDHNGRRIFEHGFQNGGRRKCVIKIEYQFINDLCVIPNLEGKCGLIDTLGRWVVEPKYDAIYEPETSGYRYCSSGDKIGVISPQGKELYPAEYDDINIVKDRGFVLKNEGRMWQVDFDGNIVQPFMYDSTEESFCYPIAYGDDSAEFDYELSDFVKYEVMNSYGIMNRITGEPITPAIYSDINMLSKDLFEVQDPECYDWYLVDTQGNVVSKR